MKYPKLTTEEWKWLIPNYLFYNDEYISDKLRITVKELKESMELYYPQLYADKQENIEAEYCRAGERKTHNGRGIVCPYYRATFKYAVQCMRLPKEYNGFVFKSYDAEMYVNNNCKKHICDCPHKAKLEKEYGDEFNS